jgi:endonuclease/exonuclease/phosphatase (EEP) superfamily protein YafD
VAAGSLRVWLIVGILLRVTHLRDRFHPLAIVFYTTPWPCIAAGLAILALHAARLGHGHRLRRYVILTGGALFTWIALSWQWAPAVSKPVVLRVAHWNAGHPAPWRVEKLAAWLKSQDADILSIPEAEGTAKIRDWAAQFPGYHVEQLPGEMLSLVRGEVLSREDGLLANGSYYGLLHARVRGQAVTILQADLYGMPTNPRGPAAHRLFEIAHAHAGERLILVGDFNTPQDSVYFDPFRQDLFPAFAKAGRGLSETWPMPVPMLTIDHLWSSHSLVPVDAHIGWVWWSDHRPVVADFAD